jgi:hypothetical protein
MVVIIHYTQHQIKGKIMYAKILNNTIVKYPYQWNDFESDNNNTNYGYPQPDILTIFPHTDLAKEGYSVVSVNQVTQPTIDPITQDIAEGTPILENGVWTQVWNVTQASADEIAQRQAQLVITNKTKAQNLLSETDWIEVPSVTNTQNTPHLTNPADFLTYRNALRGIAVNPTYNATFPTKPTEQWS